MSQEKTSRHDQIILAVSILLFVGIYLTGFVMGLAETTRRAAHRAAHIETTPAGKTLAEKTLVKTTHAGTTHRVPGAGQTGQATKEPSQR